MSGALSGLLVADFSRVLAGPYATMLLADGLGLRSVVGEGAAAQVANPIGLDVTPPEYRLPPRALGQDDQWVREILGP